MLRASFLIDEMFSTDLVDLLAERGCDAVHVRDAGLGGATDREVLAQAVDEERVLLTENARDFEPLFTERLSTTLAVTPILIALKKGRGTGGALHARLAEDLARWASQHPRPEATIYWLPRSEV